VGRAQALGTTAAREAGDATAAAVYIEDAMRLMEACHVNPTLIDQLVAAAMSNLVSGAVSSADPTAMPVSAEQYTMLEDLLRDPVMIPDIAYALRGERIFFEQMLDFTHTESGRFLPGELNGIVNIEEEAQQSGLPSRLLNVAGIVFPSREQTERKVDEIYDLYHEALNETDPAKRDQLLAESEQLVEEAGPRYMVIHTLMPAIGSTVNAAYRTQDNQSRALINLAQARFYTVEGRLPEDTLELVGAGLIDNATVVSPATGNPILLDQLHPAVNPANKRR